MAVSCLSSSLCARSESITRLMAKSDVASLSDSRYRSDHDHHGDGREACVVSSGMRRRTVRVRRSRRRTCEIILGFLEEYERSKRCISTPRAFYARNYVNTAASLFPRQPSFIGRSRCVSAHGRRTCRRSPARPPAVRAPASHTRAHHTYPPTSRQTAA